MSPDQRPSAPARTVPAVLERAAEAHAGREAVVDEQRRLTFADLAHRVTEGAAGLVSAGVQPGDRVGLWAPNSVDWVEISLAVYAAGAVLVPLNTRFRGLEAAHVVRTAGIRLLVADRSFLGVDRPALLAEALASGEMPEVVAIGGVDEGDDPWRRLSSSATAGDGVEAARRSGALGPDSPSDIIFTSGTTGAPKGAVLNHGASVRTYQAWSDAVGLREGDRYLCAYPFFHTAGLKSGILACLLTGATLLPHAVFDVEEVLAKAEREAVSVLPGPPSLFQSILSHASDAGAPRPPLRLSVTGAAVVPAQLVERMRTELGIERVVTGYGLTETTGTVSVCHHDDPPEVVASTVGRPLPGVEVKVVDEAGVERSAGDPGELLVRGFNVMHGYFGDPDATAKAIDTEGWLATGDIGFLDETGRIHITDRKKDMFIVGGFNAYPAEIESLMTEHPGIAQVAVIGQPDERLGEVGAAWVVPVAGTTLDPDEVVRWCRDRMANYKVPRRITVVDALPLNASGKVTKYRLRQPLAGS